VSVPEAPANPKRGHLRAVPNESAAERPPARGARAANDAVKSQRELAAMDKKTRRRWVERNFPGAANTDWASSPEVVRANRQGTLYLHAEPGMIENDVRRKAAALDAHAQAGRASRVEVPAARTTVPNPLDPNAPPVRQSQAHRYGAIEQAHRQAERQGWEDKRKFGVIQRFLRSEGDHVLDLQLGGLDSLSNMWALDAYTNERLGAQIKAQLDNMPFGTKIAKVVFLAP
jgi:hypothetical protein